MRVFAAIVSVLVGTSFAYAQGDPRVPYGPLTATAKTKTQPKTPERAARRDAAANTKPARAEAPAAKPEPKRAEPAKPQPAAAKPKPEAAKPAPAKPKRDAAKPPPVSEKRDTSAATADPSRNPLPKGAKPRPDIAAAPPTTTSAAAAAAAKADQALRDSYAAIPRAELVALQSDLIWTGDYNGLINGEFSERLAEAVKSYQKRQQAKATGVFNPQERAALRAAARPRQDEVGWRLTEDPATGARIGLPLKLATKREPTTTGTRWSSQQGQLQIETFRIDTGATLEAVFEQQKKGPRQRRVTYSVMRDDFFAVSGTQGLKKFHVRGFAQNGEVRGIVILYDQAEAIMDSLVGAMSSAFAPFTTYVVANAADSPPRRRVDYATGVVVSPSGHIVTARQAVESCQVIVIPQFGNAEHIAAQVDGELALLRVYGARKLTPIGLLGTPSPGGVATLVGIADPQMQGGGAMISAAPSKVGTGSNLLPLDSPPTIGFSGAAALDGKGELLGMAVLKPAVVAGAASTPQAAIVPVATIRNFLEANYIAPASGGVGVEHAKASVVRVICVRR